MAACLLAACHEGLRLFRQWLVFRHLRSLFRGLPQSTNTEEKDDSLLDGEDPSCQNGDSLKQHVINLPENRLSYERTKLVFFSWVERNENFKSF